MKKDKRLVLILYLGTMCSLCSFLGLVPENGLAKDILKERLNALTVELKHVKPSTCLPAQFEEKSKLTFFRGICLYHNKNSEAENESIIQYLQQAQQSGLPPVYQNFAALLEGLTHCRQANFYWQKYKNRGSKDILEKIKFCKERRLGLASLSDVNWEQAYFDYAPASFPRFTLNDRLQEMAQCYEGVFDSAYGTECGLIDQVSGRELDGIVEKAVGEVMVKYFTGVESPVTGMFSRKVQRAEGLIQSTSESIEVLKKNAEPLQKKYSSYQQTYQRAKDEVLEKILSDYRTAVLKANAILDEYNRWKGGLFITSENVNLLPKIQERKKELEEELERIKEKDYLQKIQNMMGDIQSLLMEEKENARILKDLCHIYFCELMNKRSLLKAERICRQPRLLDNPLCVSGGRPLQGGIVKVNFQGSEQAQSVQEICRKAGVSEKYLKISMEAQDSAQCLQEISP